MICRKEGGVDQHWHLVMLDWCVLLGTRDGF